jgi:hypothetical protein
MCDAGALSLTTNSLDGYFNGMSHSGTLAIVRNTGSSPCRVEQLPAIGFTGADEKPLPIRSSPPRSPGMHPGPARPPLVLGPGAELTGKLRWVSGPVYDRSTCLDTAQLTLSVGGKLMVTPLVAHLCGDASSGVTFTQSFLSAEPVRTAPPPGSHIAPHIYP